MIAHSVRVIDMRSREVHAACRARPVGRPASAFRQGDGAWMQP
jgi:hypothetical protein